MQKTKKELQRELRLLEEKEKKNKKETHTLVVMDKNFDMSDVEVEPRHEFDDIEKAELISTISLLESSWESIQKIINKKSKAKTHEWVWLIVLMDGIIDGVLSIVYDVEDVKIPSLPNLDLLVIFMEENSGFISDQTLSIPKQLKNIEEAYKKNQ